MALALPLTHVQSRQTQEIVGQQAERGLLEKDEKIAACSHIFEEENVTFVNK